VAKAKPSSAHDSGAPGDDELVNLLGRSHAAFQALAHGRAGVTCCSSSSPAGSIAGNRTYSNTSSLRIRYSGRSLERNEFPSTTASDAGSPSKAGSSASRCSTNAAASCGTTTEKRPDLPCDAGRRAA
jgi:hypothetical protein